MNGALPFLFPVPTARAAPPRAHGPPIPGARACKRPAPSRPRSHTRPTQPPAQPLGTQIGRPGSGPGPSGSSWGPPHCSKPEMTMHFDLLLPGQPLALGEGGGPARRGRSEEEEAWEAHVTTGHLARPSQVASPVTFTLPTPPVPSGLGKPLVKWGGAEWHQTRS